METAVSVTVLPFDNDSRDASQDYFARGFVEDLTTELSRFPTLEILHSPAASYRLSGSVRRIQDIVRIYVQLVDSSGRQIWS
jgi:TolB-like protein